jgi:TonB family protein
VSRLHGQLEVFEMSDFDNKFMQDEELRGLLRQWTAPDAPGSLDQRVAAAYRQSMSSAAGLSDSALHPQRGSEVVTMKFCNTCQEQFADRFSFCPVDGTPLGAAPASTINAPEIEASYPVSESATFQRATATPLEASAPVATPFEAPAPATTPFEAPTPAATPFEAPAAAAATSGQAAATTGVLMLGEYHLTILEDKGLVPRLAGELSGVAHNYQLTWPEFKRDPFGFVKRSIQGYGQMVGGIFASRDAIIAVGISLVAMVVLVGVIMVMDRSQSAGISRIGLIGFGVVAFGALIATFASWFSREKGAAVMGARPADSRNVLSGIVAALVVVFGVVGVYLVYANMQQKAEAKAAAEEEMELTQMITDIPNEQPTPDEGTAGMAKGTGGGSKPKQEKAGGGGGGGREEQTPASFGKLPQADLRIPQVVAPDPHPPVIKNPALPMPATLDADPALFPPDTRQLQYGDPKSKSTTPSSGSGTGNGIGQGTGGGVGPGTGGGYGPGNGGNTGGGDRREGGGGPGGGGGGTDYSRIFSGREVNSKARVLSKPEPTYTEAARKNQITGTVVLRAVFSAGGQVINISAVSRLPDGLTERAIAAAKQIRFVPATKDGHPVSMWMELQYNFNLY